MDKTQKLLVVLLAVIVLVAGMVGYNIYQVNGLKGKVVAIEDKTLSNNSNTKQTPEKPTENPLSVLKENLGKKSVTLFFYLTT
ncbi:hypothetical protein [Carboxydothermus ferrireducens]|uniref:Uncharacterized protein n=1 Tax=Carboxydothermus ferrireducens DSM 11255 TaxID=1119529 RepID=A0ABX2R7K4_9THEO|nr:hypothetical protein [Carboxydothermus ferrireducens]NYE57154.1 hypothetical protein [Carboxydothermus ferrireducens DSM 11255]